VKWVARALAVILALYALFILLVAPLSFRFIGLILFGWIGFLVRVIPMVTFNPDVAWAAAASLTLALFGLHWMLRAFSRHRGGESARWRFAWTWKITVLGLLLFPAAIAAIGTVHQIAWLHTGPSLIDRRGRRSREANSIECFLLQSNLQWIGESLKLFAKDNQNHLPNTLYELAPRYFENNFNWFFADGDALDEPPQEFLYYSGHSLGEKPDTIVLAYPVLFHSPEGDKRVVLHLDASTALLPEAAFQEKIRQQRAQASGHGSAPFTTEAKAN
jgi:hypothetical protein